MLWLINKQAKGDIGENERQGGPDCYTGSPPLSGGSKWVLLQQTGKPFECRRHNWRADPLIAFWLPVARDNGKSRSTNPGIPESATWRSI
ncbi:Hypothetical protein NTJ_05716 [Nesidiocoris tenuis]|uniref:Uncharacterized protein n=1 Tax=Nesidiocoris tenuis TaxID=355587 RepID=A0ABN7AKY9_9HEMI|nr:Hypothetical protein NTJ_05716 [Nesidiocoris tenuis]